MSKDQWIRDEEAAIEAFAETGDKEAFTHELKQLGFNPAEIERMIEEAAE